MSSNKDKIAAVVVLYNPECDIINNLQSYINQVNKLFIIDNSTVLNQELANQIKQFDNIEYLKNPYNVGIASALNTGAVKAIGQSFEFLLTMDQDSSFSNGAVENMLNELLDNKKIGILSPFLIHVNNPKTPSGDKLTKITVAMTSGSIIRLSAYQEIGGFEEKLFIDYVDNEYCLRMQLFGYKIMQLNSAYLYHNLGDVRAKNFFFIKVFPTNHSPIRLYYRTRNRFYVYSKYKKFSHNYILKDVWLFIKEIIKIILYESNAMKKIKMILFGYMDFRKNIFGPKFYP